MAPAVPPTVTRLLCHLTVVPTLRTYFATVRNCAVYWKFLIWGGTDPVSSPVLSASSTADLRQLLP